jgi:hypothetical protein
LVTLQWPVLAPDIAAELSRASPLFHHQLAGHDYLTRFAAGLEDCARAAVRCKAMSPIGGLSGPLHSLSILATTEEQTRSRVYRNWMALGSGGYIPTFLQATLVLLSDGHPNMEASTTAAWIWGTIWRIPRFLGALILRRHGRQCNHCHGVIRICLTHGPVFSKPMVGRS